MNEDLKEFLDVYNYDPLTGIFTLKITRGPKTVGSVSGGLNKDGYIQIDFNGKKYLSHRMAWLFMNGEWPDGIIDHKDTVRSNNKYDNLRVVNNSISNRNRGVSKRNTSGFVGVSWDKRSSKWVATICVNGKMERLGLFEYKEDAILARMTAEKKYNYWVDRAMDCL